jgi:hypothetical protein
METKPVLILADLQWPNINPVLLYNVERYMASRIWYAVIYLGDMLDMDAISHHAMEAQDLRDLEKKRLKQSYEEFSNVLRRHRKIVGKKCQMYYFMGNHEEWADRLVDKVPGIEGLIEVAYNLPFTELNIKTIWYRDFLKLGKVVFIHGDIQKGSYTPVNVAKKIVEIYNRNIVVGHYHTLQAYTKISPQGIDETHTAYIIPCLADTKPDWSKGQPTRWINGFAVYYWTDDAFSVIPVVSAKNGTFISPEGKFYGINK